jgi:hypothetical protein
MFSEPVQRGKLILNFFWVGAPLQNLLKLKLSMYINRRIRRTGFVYRQGIREMVIFTMDLICIACMLKKWKRCWPQINLKNFFFTNPLKSKISMDLFLCTYTWLYRRPAEQGIHWHVEPFAAKVFSFDAAAAESLSLLWLLSTLKVRLPFQRNLKVWRKFFFLGIDFSSRFGAVQSMQGKYLFLLVPFLGNLVIEY